MPKERMQLSRCLIAGVSIVLVSGCATWSSGEVTDIRPTSYEVQQTSPERILLTEGDLPDRPYTVLGDISVTVNKATAFNADPTREMVNEKLKVEAAKLGADAVIHVRYGTIGVSLLSWGSLDGQGRAVQFKR